MIRVGINGYGTIGKRIADAIVAQPDMSLTGVAKLTPDYVAMRAQERSYPLYYVDDSSREEFQTLGIDVAGPVDDLVAKSDVIIDATPAGVGEQNRTLYERHDTPALYQGGEDATVAATTFNSRANYDDAAGLDAVRVASCNTTGLTRLLTPLQEQFGIERARATLVRRGGDPNQPSRGPINDALPDPITVPSHHAKQVTDIMDVPIETLAMKVPVTLMHLHSVSITLEEAPTMDAVRDLLTEDPRLFAIPGEVGLDGAGALKELAKDADRPRADVWENCIWDDSLTLDGRELSLFQAIHQEAIVVPENIDAVRAILDTDSRAASRTRTNEQLGIDDPLLPVDSLQADEPSIPAE
ncbi:type II glyceraldehyde-3-phosphate dehydrogenase [Halovenus marina]|uniref:type II glyceraldehyde-3-phosphate dehydrogenase n=1 Tax=Halovenus marina TaxID=3396621 RepID=UPI003F56E04D